jgi:cell division inhibitor SepF
MAGAMRKMGVYLGLVEDDEPIANDADELDDAYQSDYRRDGFRSESGYGDSGYDYAERSDYSGGGSESASAARRESSPARATVSAGYAGSSTSASTASTATATQVSPWERTENRLERTIDRSLDRSIDRGPDRALEQAAAMARITTVHPRTYNEARTIGEQFRSGTPVIMNLTEMDDSDAKRLVDFAAGLTFGLRGSIDRVTNRVFLLSPHNVDVTAEDKARIAEGGFFNQS